MSFAVIGVLAVVGLLAAGGFYAGQRKALAGVRGGVEFHSTPDYCGWYVVVWSLGPALAVSVVALLLQAFLPLVLPADATFFIPGWFYAGVWVLLPLVSVYPAWRRVGSRLRARNSVERWVYAVLFGASLISILATVGIVLTILFEAYRFFSDVSIVEFITGTTWEPDTAFLGGAGRGEEEMSEPRFGAVPLFAGTFLITFIAMLVAVPIGVLSAVYMSEFAPLAIRRTAKPMLEILAGIPTVVYGFFAAITVSPLVVDIAEAAGLEADYTNALSPGLIMGIMIIPFMSSLSDDVITAVPQSLRQAALALGATRAEVIRQVVLPAAFPGIISAFLLAVSRAVGETMIVVMAAGLQPNLTANPLEGVTTVTVRIVDALVGDQEFDSAETLSAFGLGLALLIVTLIFNIISSVAIRKFHQKYE